MPKKRSRGKSEDPMRRLVQGILTLVLSTLASFVAAKLTDLILGSADESEEKVSA